MRCAELLHAPLTPCFPHHDGLLPEKRIVWYYIILINNNKKNQNHLPCAEWAWLCLRLVNPTQHFTPKREEQSWVGYSSFRVASLGSHFFPDFIYFRASLLLSRLFTLPNAIDCLFPLICLPNDVCESWTALYFPALVYSLALGLR